MSVALTEKFNLVTASKNKNVLHYFRSQTALFQLSCLEQETLQSNDSEKLAKEMNSFSLVESGGINRSDEYYKQNATSGTPNPGLAGKNINLLNTGQRQLDFKSKFITIDGQYLDFYFDDLEIETLPDFNKDTGFSKATKIKFTIIEPYSLSGFLQTLQAGAIKAGYVSYVSAPFVLRVKFIGYPDSDDVGTAVEIDAATRYFVIRFTEVSIRADESGTKYYCKAVPLNEYAFGEANRLLGNVTAQGETIGQILKDFETKINNVTKYAIFTKAPQVDTYKIIYPTIDASGAIDEAADNTDITEARIGSPSTSNVNYSYDSPIDPEPHPPPKDKKITVTFAAGANIHDCIAGIIRDSRYITRIFEGKKLKIDATGSVQYFNISCSTIPTGWSIEFSRPIYQYIFKVLPHRIHYSRIPEFANKNINLNQIRKRVRRKYEYLYQGKNLDVLRFDLNFNYMYFQAASISGGEQQVSQGSSAPQSTPAGLTNQGNFASTDSIRDSGGNIVRSGVNLLDLVIANAGQNTRAGQEREAYIYMAKKFHAAILENLSQSLLELEILGDPYYLSHQGLNNFKSQADTVYLGITTNGDMDYQTGEIYIELAFRNPIDIDADTGFMTFSDDITTYSGIYRLTNVVSRFSNGMFTQTLKLIRLERQDGESHGDELPDGVETSTNGSEASFLNNLASLDITSIPDIKWT